MLTQDCFIVAHAFALVCKAICGHWKICGEVKVNKKTASDFLRGFNKQLQLSKDICVLAT